MRRTRFLLSVLVFGVLCAATSQSATLTLRRADGSTYEMKGEVKHYEDNKFVVVLHSGGEMSLSLEQVQIIEFSNASSKTVTFEDTLTLRKDDGSTYTISSRVKHYGNGEFLVLQSSGEEASFTLEQVENIELAWEKKEKPGKTKTAARSPKLPAREMRIVNEAKKELEALRSRHKKYTGREWIRGQVKVIYFVFSRKQSIKAMGTREGGCWRVSQIKTGEDSEGKYTAILAPKPRGWVRFNTADIIGIQKIEVCLPPAVDYTAYPESENGKLISYLVYRRGHGLLWGKVFKKERGIGVRWGDKLRTGCFINKNDVLMVKRADNIVGYPPMQDPFDLYLEFGFPTDIEKTFDTITGKEETMYVSSCSSITRSCRGKACPFCHGSGKVKNKTKRIVGRLKDQRPYLVERGGLGTRYAFIKESSY